MKYVVISGEPSGRHGIRVDLAIGPFADINAADEMRDLLERTTTGSHKVLALQEPGPGSRERRARTHRSPTGQSRRTGGAL